MNFRLLKGSKEIESGRKKKIMRKLGCLREQAVILCRGFPQATKSSPNKPISLKLALPAIPSQNTL